MTDWKLIKESDIPTKHSATTSFMQRSLDIVSSLKPGTAAAVPLPEGITVRGQRGSLTKAAKTLGVSIDLTDRDNVVYVRLLNG